MAEELTLVEMRVKVKGIRWEDIPPVTFGLYATRQYTLQKKAYAIAIALSRGNGGAEVRWNLQGYYQGHYIRG